MEPSTTKFRWDGRKVHAALLCSQGMTAQQIADQCYVTAETVQVWERHPTFQARVNHYVELAIADWHLKDETGKELHKAMPAIIGWLRRMVTDGADGLAIGERLALAFKMLDRGGVLDQKVEPQVLAQANQPQILFDNRKQILAPGNEELAKELEHFRTTPPDIPFLQNGHSPNPDKEVLDGN